MEFLDKVKEIYENNKGKNIYIAYPDLIGMPVITISNAKDESRVCVGILKRWEKAGRLNNNDFPIIEFENGEFLSFAIVLPYSPELYNFAKSIDEDKVLQVFGSISLTIQRCHRK